MVYRITLTPDDNDTYFVEVPAFPEVKTFGVGEADCLRHAADAIEEAIAGRIHDGEDMPQPDPFVDGALMVHVPVMSELKADLYRVLRASGITRAELTRRLDWKRNSVDRLFDLNHASRLEQIEAAFGALGYDVEVVRRTRERISA